MIFKDLLEVSKYFSEPENCFTFLSNARWGTTPYCIYCGNQTVYRLKSIKNNYKCKSCHKTYSVIKGTIFEKSQIPLEKWFLATYLFVNHKKGISAAQLSRDLNVTHKSAWFMLHRLRFAIKEKEYKKMFGVLQCDESYIGGKNKNKAIYKRGNAPYGRSLKDKVPVFGILQTGHKVYVEVVSNTSRSSIQPIIKKIAAEDSILITDEWKAYKRLPDEYFHVLLQHNKYEYTRGGFHNNSIEGFWSLLKRGLHGTYHCVSKKHLQKYCDEFAYRYNTRLLKDGKRFELSFERVDGRLMYKDLIK